MLWFIACWVYGVGVVIAAVGVIWLIVVAFLDTSPYSAFATYFTGIGIGLIGAVLFGVSLRKARRAATETPQS